MQNKILCQRGSLTNKSWDKVKSFGAFKKTRFALSSDITTKFNINSTNTTFIMAYRSLSRKAPCKEPSFLKVLLILWSARSLNFLQLWMSIKKNYFLGRLLVKPETNVSNWRKHHPIMAHFLKCSLSYSRAPIKEIKVKIWTKLANEENPRAIFFNRASFLKARIVAFSPESVIPWQLW